MADSFFTEHDLFYMINAVNDIKGIATVRILPYKFNDFKQFGSSIIKIIRKRDS